MIESIDIGDEIDRGERKAKQAGSLLSEMFVVASRFRSVMAGVPVIVKSAPIIACDSEFGTSPAVVQCDS